MKVLPPAILFFEAVVVALAIPVAVTAAGRGPGAAWLLAVLALLLLLVAGMARRPRGVAVGWVLQFVVIAAGLLVPALLVLGVVFLALWVAALVYGARGDALAARNAAAARTTRSTGGGAAPGTATGTAAGGPSSGG